MEQYVVWVLACFCIRRSGFQNQFHIYSKKNNLVVEIVGQALFRKHKIGILDRILVFCALTCPASTDASVGVVGSSGAATNHGKVVPHHWPRYLIRN